MLPAILLAAALLPGIAPGAAFAQPRSFNCIGAEHLEEDVFAIPFARGAAAPGEAAKTNLAAAAERAKGEPERNLCILGHAGPQEGGAQSGLQLAARRAGEVAAALAKLGVDRDRLRAEARRAAFARGALPEERSVTVVLLPAQPGGTRPAEPRPEVPAGPRDRPAEPAAAPRPVTPLPAIAPESPAGTQGPERARPDPAPGSPRDAGSASPRP